MAASIGLVIFVPLYYELVHHLSASDSGLALVPLALTTPGSILSGRAMLHMRRYKWAPEVGLVVGIAGLGLLIWQPALALGGVIVIMSLGGIAVGTVYPVCTVSIQNAVPNHQVGVAMGAMNFFRPLASAFAVAVMGLFCSPDWGLRLSGAAAPRRWRPTSETSDLILPPRSVGSSRRPRYFWWRHW